MMGIPSGGLVSSHGRLITPRDSSLRPVASWYAKLPVDTGFTQSKTSESNRSDQPHAEWSFRAARPVRGT
jgi:hypothetical protein